MMTFGIGTSGSTDTSAPFSTRGEPGKVVISICSLGPGPRPELLPRAFGSSGVRADISPGLVASNASQPFEDTDDARERAPAKGTLLPLNVGGGILNQLPLLVGEVRRPGTAAAEIVFDRLPRHLDCTRT